MQTLAVCWRLSINDKLMDCLHNERRRHQLGRIAMQPAAAAAAASAHARATTAVRMSDFITRATGEFNVKRAPSQ